MKAFAGLGDIGEDAVDQLDGFREEVQKQFKELGPGARPLDDTGVMGMVVAMRQKREQMGEPPVIAVMRPDRSIVMVDPFIEASQYADFEFYRKAARIFGTEVR